MRYNIEKVKKALSILGIESNIVDVRYHDDPELVGFLCDGGELTPSIAEKIVSRIGE